MGAETFLGEVTCTAATFPPSPYYTMCYGQVVPITDYTTLFSLTGALYGGDGRICFGMPDMRGRTAVGVGNGPGLSEVRLGDMRGYETQSLPLQRHYHNATFTPTSSGGTTTVPVTGTIANSQGSIAEDAPLSVSSSLSGSVSIAGSASISGSSAVSLDGDLMVNDKTADSTTPINGGAIAKPAFNGNPVGMFDSAPNSAVSAGRVSVSGDVPSTGYSVDTSGLTADSSSLAVSTTGRVETQGIPVDIPDPMFSLSVDVGSTASGEVSVAETGVPNASVSTISPQLGLHWMIAVEGLYPSRP